jgi:phage terminase large subunit GpA-like protein
MKSARVGYTKMLNATIGYYIDHDPCPIMVSSRRSRTRRATRRKRSRRCCATARRSRDSCRRREDPGLDNTILHKRFPAACCRWSARTAAAGSAASREGRWLRRGRRLSAERRQRRRSRSSSASPHRVLLEPQDPRGSTPTIAGASRIERLFLAGDQRRYYVPCRTLRVHAGAACSARARSTTGKRSGTSCAGRKGTARRALRLPRLRRRDRAQAQARHGHAGEWRPGPHAQFPDDAAHAPFTGTRAFTSGRPTAFRRMRRGARSRPSSSPRSAPAPEQLKTFVNTVLGETWKERGEAPDWERLYQRENPTRSAVPGGRAVPDRRRRRAEDRLMYEVVGWGRGKRSWSIDAGRAPGRHVRPEAGALAAAQGAARAHVPHA